MTVAQPYTSLPRSHSSRSDSTIPSKHPVGSFPPLWKTSPPETFLSLPLLFPSDGRGKEECQKLTHSRLTLVALDLSSKFSNIDLAHYRGGVAPKILVRKPCWYSHALHIHARSDWSINFTSFFFTTSTGSS